MAPTEVGSEGVQESPPHRLLQSGEWDKAAPQAEARKSGHSLRRTSARTRGPLILANRLRDLSQHPPASVPYVGEEKKAEQGSRLPRPPPGQILILGSQTLEAGAD